LSQVVILSKLFYNKNQYLANQAVEVRPIN